MSIPITCAGCQSAFDVPDNLAGKTIRCTSCKAQMAVPEDLDAVEAVRAAADTPAPKKALPKATPVAKAVASVATAKKAAVAEVDEDEDDERPKAKPVKGATGKKSGIVGSTKKNRDDDDDDDDDKPARKKKQGGGSGPMIAIIAAGAVGLAAIAGVGIWLLSGDKKPETAANTSNANNSTSTPPNGTPAGSMKPPGGALPPGSGTSMPPPGSMPPGSGTSMPPPGAKPPGSVTAMPPGGFVPGGSTGGMPPGAFGSGIVPGQPNGGMPPGGSSLGPVGAPPGSPMTIPGSGSLGPVSQPPGNPMGPPGIGPMPGGFGGFGSNQPPASEGHLKTKIANFYTAAFDAENKEIYTIALRQPDLRDPRTIKGELYRYSYPDFKELGKFKLPQLGVRAVIDSKAGLLYVATVTNPVAAQINSLENSSASGDIAIYDLKPIRDGKTDEGKTLANNSELKPVVVNFKHTIHALELSDDGKSLYVLSTSLVSNKKQSAFVVIDTETRKEAKRVVLPALVKDMVKAGDGKNFLIIEDFIAKDKTSSVREFDPTTMTAATAPSTFQGAVLDIAPLAGGGAIVSVLPPMNPAGGGVGAPPGGGGFVPPGGIAPPGGFRPPGGGGTGRPPGGPGGGPGGGATAPQLHFVWFLLDSKGITEMDPGVASRAANGGHVEYSPDGKKLFVSSFNASGLDVYDVEDATAANGLKLKSSARTAKGKGWTGVELKGHFFVTPDGKALVFHDGAVIDTDNVGGAALGTGNGGAGGAPAFPGGGAKPPGGGMPPGGFGMPPGGFGMPPGGFGGGAPAPNGPPGAPPLVPLTPGGPPGGVAPVPGGPDAPPIAQPPPKPKKPPTTVGVPGGGPAAPPPP